MARDRIITVLIIEPEVPENVSARKLVVETAKHNVLSAYGGAEGLKLFQRFPRVDAIFVHSELKDVTCDETILQLRRMDSNIPIVVLTPDKMHSGASVTKTLSSHEPSAILNFLSKELGASITN